MKIELFGFILDEILFGISWIKYLKKNLLWRDFYWNDNQLQIGFKPKDFVENMFVYLKLHVIYINSMQNFFIEVYLPRFVLKTLCHVLFCFSNFSSIKKFLNTQGKFCMNLEDFYLDEIYILFQVLHEIEKKFV